MSATKPLTPPMKDLLLAMRAGVRLHLMAGGRYAAYFFRSDTMRNCTRPADGLWKRGLIRNPDTRYNRKPWELTDEGRQLADELKPK